MGHANCRCGGAVHATDSRLTVEVDGRERGPFWCRAAVCDRCGDYALSADEQARLHRLAAEA